MGLPCAREGQDADRCHAHLNLFSQKLKIINNFGTIRNIRDYTEMHPPPRALLIAQA